MNVNVTGGTGSVSYEWDQILPTGAPNPLGASATFDPSPLSGPQTYEYQVTVTYNGNGCDPAPSNIVTINVADDPSSDTILFYKEVFDLGLF